MQRWGWQVRAGRLGRVLGMVLAAYAWPVGATTIASFSPQGEVAQVRQLALRFSQAVVAFGEPRLPDPVTVQCSGPVPDGKGRWVDDQAWVYDFREALPPGSRCSITLRTGWSPRSGATPLTGRREFAFNTGGPAVLQVAPYEGATIEEDQHFLLQLNGPATAASVVANSWCEVEGIGERQPVQLVEGARVAPHGASAAWRATPLARTSHGGESVRTARRSVPTCASRS